MKIPDYLVIALGTCISGMLFYALYNEIIIIRFPWTTNVYTRSDLEIQKKIYTLVFWHNNSWKTEHKPLISSENKTQTLTYLISSWLSMLEEEHVFAHRGYRKVSLQSVMLDPAGHEAFLSFDRSPFLKESSTSQKLLWIEGLLRTIRENNVSLSSVRLLAHHQPLHDQHLDFDRAWPISGFLLNS